MSRLVACNKNSLFFLEEAPVLSNGRRIILIPSRLSSHPNYYDYVRPFAHYVVMTNYMH